MKKVILGMAMFAVLASSGFAAPKKAPAKIVDVYTCPTTLESSKGASGGSEVVGKYRVHFCCPGCKQGLDKLSPKAKAAKVAAAVKKDKARVKS